MAEHPVIVSIPELRQVLGEEPIGLGMALKRDRGLESDLLQRGVCELSVPCRASNFRFGSPAGRRTPRSFRPKLIYSAFARGVDGLWGGYQWLDRAPKGRNEPTYWWWRHHDRYEKP